MQAAVNKRRVRDPTLMAWVRELHLLEALHSFQIRVIYLPGKHNVLADHLSRGRLTPFKVAYVQRFGCLPDSVPLSVPIPDLSEPV